MTGKKKGGKEKEERTCNYKMHADKPCDRKLYDDEHCIFHSKDIEGKKEKFNDAFLKEFERQKKRDKEYDLTGFVFPGDISFNGKEFEKNVDFTNAQFSGEVDFERAQFSGKAYFWYAQFSEKADFYYAQFSGEVVFNEAQFSRMADFGGAQFSGDAIFGHAQFSGWADFKETQFSRMASFGVAQFSGMANFEKSQFSVVTYFNEAQFSRMAYFGVAQFSGDAIFGHAQFSGEAVFNKAQFSRMVDFGGAQFSGKAYFRNARFFGKANFNKAKFKEDTNFEDFILEKYNNFEMLDTYFHNVSGLFEFIEENKKKFKFSNKTEFLPDNFRLILGEEATARYPIISRKIRDDMYLLRFKEKHPKMHFIWWLFADCGRSFMRWAAWCIFFACLFGFVFWGMGTENFKIPKEHSPFAYFYYSIVTFTTLGFGDIVPMTLLGRILVTIEVILGYIGLGGLISIFANKLARRS